MEEKNIVIYQTKDGNIDVKLENETVWLTQKQMAFLFGKNVKTINEHIVNIFKQKELSKSSTIRKFQIVQTEKNRVVERKIDHYNLDMIISVGYRVNSKQGIQFRKWATNKLKEYLVQGYSLNIRLLEEKTKKLKNLQKTFNLLNRSITNQAENLDEAQQIMKILSDFSSGFNLLDDFDNERLDTKGKTKKNAVFITKDEFMGVVEKMKTSFTSPLFGSIRDNSFESSVNQIYQTFGGTDCYPTIEEKAVNLLYMIVKNHSFADGNKRIGANCFLYFLNKNGLLYKNGESLIDASTLATLTLLIAESKPAEADIVKQIALSIINRSEK